MKAEYIDHMGDDLRVVNAARVSFNKESYLTDDERIQERDKKLINYLATHGHWTPFAHPMITMRETVPIFIARQRVKHMIGFTYNEVSRRYVDDTPEFFTPAVWRSRPDGSVKQGSGGEHPASDHWRAQYISLKEHVLDLYDAMIEEGVAPEQARMVLPQSMLTSYYVTGSLAAWARAYKQRSDAHAQQEIQELAKDWDDVLRWHFPVCWEALVGG